MSCTVLENSPLALNAADFAAAFSAGTGYALSSVSFSLSATDNGTLYYKYRSADDYDALVTAGTAYYNGASPSLSDLTFVPAAGFTERRPLHTPPITKRAPASAEASQLPSGKPRPVLFPTPRTRTRQ